MNRKELNSILDDYQLEDDSCDLLPEEFEEALVGFKLNDNDQIVIIYSENKIIEILCYNGAEGGMSYSDAREYYEFNMISNPRVQYIVTGSVFN